MRVEGATGTPLRRTVRSLTCYCRAKPPSYSWGGESDGSPRLPAWKPGQAVEDKPAGGSAETLAVSNRSSPPSSPGSLAALADGHSHPPSRSSLLSTLHLLHPTCEQKGTESEEAPTSKRRRASMVSVGLQLVGYILGLLGLLGTLIATLLPNWRISSYIGSSIVTAVGFSKGLWMECAIFSTGITQCDIYNSLLSLPTDLQVAQALMATSVAIGSLAAIVSVAGMRCTIFSQSSPAKDKVAILGGVTFVLGALLSFIPVVWNMHVILSDFYNPLVPDSMKYEIGEALYLGILSSLISFIGGAILCASCPPRDSQATCYRPHHSRTMADRSSLPSPKASAYSQTGYV
ncbi:hypothetical protein E2320_013200 [Naja naja]|nr:hypothetical protein E2320_013200 [Naja naja]